MQSLHKKYLLIILFLLWATYGKAQVGIGTVAPNSSAALDVTSTTKGVLLPRLSNAQAITLSGTSPVQGLLIYNTDRKCIQVYSGTSFQCLLTGSADTTNDAWVNDSVNTMVKLGTNSNGRTARTAGSEFVVKDNGNVGIGTTSPSSPLYVNSSDSVKYNNIASFMSPNNTKAGNASLINIGVANSSKNQFQMRYVHQGSGNDSNRMDLGWNGVVAATMALLADGKVGIGTNTPSAILDIKPASTSASGLRIQNISNTDNKQDTNINYASGSGAALLIDGNGYVYKKFNPTTSNNSSNTFDDSYNITSTATTIVSVNDLSIIRFALYSNALLGPSGVGSDLYAEVTYSNGAGFQLITYGFDNSGTNGTTLSVTGQGTKTLTFDFSSGADLVITSTATTTTGVIQMSQTGSSSGLYVSVFDSFRSR